MTPGAGRDNKLPELEFDRTPYMASFRKMDAISLL